jgi:hypothetical protein
MTSDLEKRIGNALGAIVQRFPETRQEASRMTAEQWAAFQDAVSRCSAIHAELGGSICHGGTWFQVGRQAAERVNNATAA